MRVAHVAGHFLQSLAEVARIVGGERSWSMSDAGGRLWLWWNLGQAGMCDVGVYGLGLTMV